MKVVKKYRALIKSYLYYFRKKNPEDTVFTFLITLLKNIMSSQSDKKDFTSLTQAQLITYTKVIELPSKELFKALKNMGIIKIDEGNFEEAFIARYSSNQSNTKGSEVLKFKDIFNEQFKDQLKYLEN